jgi:hypothetical protein
MIAVIQAHKERKQIQFRDKYRFGAQWGNLPGHDSMAFNFVSCEYRIKPEPAVCWMNDYGDSTTYYARKDLAMQTAGPDAIRIAVKMVEAEE